MSSDESKAKAQELFNKFYPLAGYDNSGIGQLVDLREFQYSDPKKPTAKKCAMICIDEIIETAHDNGGPIRGYEQFISDWKSIKEEIQKL